MTTDSTTTDDDANLFLGAAWFDPIEAGIRGQIRGFIEELIEQELAAALGRQRYQRRPRATAGTEGPAATPEAGDAPSAPPVTGHRHGRRTRRLVGSFGAVEIAVPRARLRGAGGAAREWRSAVLPRYARRTRQVEALIAGAYLAGTNTRRVRRALAALFKGAIAKDTVSRVWRKVKTDWEAWSRRSLAEEDVVRLIVDGTVVRARLDRRAATISLLVVLGVRRDGRKVLLAVKNMGGESEAAWRAVLDDLIARGLRTPEFLIIDGAAGLEKALAALWPAVPTQRCTVHKHRNLLAHAPDHLHEEVSADYTDMIYAGTAEEVAARRQAFIREWRLRCRAVADSLEEAGERLFTFTRLPPSRWRSARTTNAVERLHEEFKRRIKTQTVLPSPETAAMLFRALLASGQITMRKVDGRPTPAARPTDAVIDLAA
jgi:putative transposase